MLVVLKLCNTQRSHWRTGCCISNLWDLSQLCPSWSTTSIDEKGERWAWAVVDLNLENHQVTKLNGPEFLVHVYIQYHHQYFASTKLQKATESNNLDQEILLCCPIFWASCILVYIYIISQVFSVCVNSTIYNVLESPLYKLNKLIKLGGWWVGSVVRELDWKSKGWGFESCQEHKKNLEFFQVKKVVLTRYLCAQPLCVYACIWKTMYAH